MLEMRYRFVYNYKLPDLMASSSLHKTFWNIKGLLFHIDKIHSLKVHVFFNQNEISIFSNALLAFRHEDSSDCFVNWHAELKTCSILNFQEFCIYPIKSVCYHNDEDHLYCSARGHFSTHLISTSSLRDAAVFFGSRFVSCKEKQRQEWSSGIYSLAHEARKSTTIPKKG